MRGNFELGDYFVEVFDILGEGTIELAMLFRLRSGPTLLDARNRVPGTVFILHVLRRRVDVRSCSGGLRGGRTIETRDDGGGYSLPWTFGFDDPKVLGIDINGVCLFSVNAVNWVQGQRHTWRFA